MELIHGTAELRRKLNRPILTIGNFDGLHLGHQTILDTVTGRARALGGESVLYTFDPHPRKVLQPDRGPELLVNLDQKVELLAAAGLDVLIVEPFDLAFAKTPPQVFIHEYIHSRIAPREVYVGYDFHFGRDREGSMRLLTETGPQLGFSVTIIPEVTIHGKDVNSTRIRELLREGEVEEAHQLLGRPFSIRGPVVQGDQRGRQLGFPTANVASENEIRPAPGVYACRLRMLDEGHPDEGTVLPAVANLGSRPTFGESAASSVEAHAIDFQGDLYGRHVELSFIDRIREERKFSGPEALKEQIGRDVVEAHHRLRGDSREDGSSADG